VFPTIDEPNECCFMASPMPSDGIKHSIAAGAILYRSRQGISPPGKSHLAKHRLICAGNNATKPPVEVKENP
jgi:hypothetical protein